MIKLFAGSDILDSYNAAKDYAHELAEKSGLELSIINADEENAQSLWDNMQQIGLFSSKKIQLWKRVLDNKEVADMLAQRFDLLNANNEIIIWQPAELDNRLSLVKKLTAAKQVKSFTAPKPWEVSSWLSLQVKAFKLPLTDSQQRWLLERTGADKSQLYNELIKIQLYFDAKQQISQAELELLIPQSVEMQIWSVLDSLSLDNKAKALKTLEAFANEDNLQYLITMLSREITMLSKIRYASQANIALNSLGIHEFVLKKAMPKAQKFSLDKLKRLSMALFRLDTAVKRGKTDPLTGLFLVAMAW